MKFLKKYCRSVTLSILFIVGSGTTFAENPLVTQAKELQTGSEKVGIDHQKAIALLKKAADAGDAEAMYLLSQYYTSTAQTNYLFESQRKVDELLYKAVIHGHLKATEEFYTNYNFDQISYGTSSRAQYMPTFFAKVRELAKNDPYMKLILAKILLEESARSPKNIELERCKLFEQAYQKIPTEAAFGVLACKKTLNLNAEQIKQAELNEQKFLDDSAVQVLTIKAKADKDDIRASIELLEHESALYDLPDGEKLIPKLKAKVQNFYEQQGKKGYADAYIHLAKQEVENQKRQKWLLKAIDLNSTVAMNQLALQWMFLEDDPKLAQKAEKLLERSVTLGDANGMYQLAIWKYRQLNESSNIKASLQEIQSLFEKSAAKGQLQAMDLLAGIEEDEPENYKWAVKAYENGSDDIDVLELAQVAFEKGLGTSKDLKKAKEIKELNIIKKKIHKIQFPNG